MFYSFFYFSYNLETIIVKGIYQNYFMTSENKQIHEKLILPGLSTFNIPSISYFPNIMEDSMKFIITQRNIGIVSKDFLDPQKDNSQNDFQDDSLALRLEIAEPTTCSGKKKRMGCTCKKTFCLKMYCECFANNKICHDDCVCCDCKNIIGNDKIIEEAKTNVKQKGTHTCSISQKRCNCKKSFCQKKYCECFNAGISCSQACKCIECCNKDDLIMINRHESGSSIKQELPHSKSFLQKSLQNLQNV